MAADVEERRRGRQAIPPQRGRALRWRRVWRMALQRGNTGPATAEDPPGGPGPAPPPPAPALPRRAGHPRRGLTSASAAGLRWGRACRAVVGCGLVGGGPGAADRRGGGWCRAGTGLLLRGGAYP